MPHYYESVWIILGEPGATFFGLHRPDDIDVRFRIQDDGEGRINLMFSDGQGGPFVALSPYTITADGRRLFEMHGDPGETYGLVIGDRSPGGRFYSISSEGGKLIFRDETAGGKIVASFCNPDLEAADDPSRVYDPERGS